MKKHILPSPKNLSERLIVEALSDIEDALGATPRSSTARPGWVPLDGREQHAWPLDDYLFASGQRGVLRDSMGRADMTLFDDCGQADSAPFLSRCVRAHDYTVLNYCDTSPAPNSMASAKGAGVALSAWVCRLAEGAGNSAIIGYIDNLGTVIYGITVDGATGALGFVIRHTTGGTQSYSSPLIVPTNVWCHVALSYIEAGSRPYLFLNGVMVSPGGLAPNDTVNWAYGTAPSRWFIGYPTSTYANFMVSDMRVHLTSRMTTDPGSVNRAPSGQAPAPDPYSCSTYWRDYYRIGLQGMSSGILDTKPIGK